MELNLIASIVVGVLFFFVAFLYSSVGHGGASGYLAILSFLSVSPQAMSTTSLILNIIVASIAAYSFIREKHFSFTLALPFVLAAIPFAFIGGAMKISSASYNILLAIILTLAAIRLVMNVQVVKPTQRRVPALPASLPIGATIGFVSGIVGVGGGIFLSPLLMLAGWADAKHAAAVSAVFIVANSLAGLAGRAVQSNLMVGNLLPSLFIATIGGIAGSHFGAKKFSEVTLRRILAAVLTIASAKLIVVLL